MCTSTCSLVTLTALKTLVCTSTPVHRHVHLHSKYSNCVVATRQQQLFKTIVCQLCWRGNSRGNPQALPLPYFLFFSFLPRSLFSPFLPLLFSPPPPVQARGGGCGVWLRPSAHFRKLMAACEGEKKSSSIRASKKCQTGKRGSTGRRSLSH